MNNPRVLAEALQHAEDVAKAEEADATKGLVAAHRQELEHDPTSPVLGNPEGDVTVVEFFDYRCPYCKASAPVVQQLLDHDKQVRLVLKEYPILGRSRCSPAAWRWSPASTQICRVPQGDVRARGQAHRGDDPRRGEVARAQSGAGGKGSPGQRHRRGAETDLDLARRSASTARRPSMSATPRFPAPSARKISRTS